MGMAPKPKYPPVKAFRSSTKHNKTIVWTPKGMLFGGFLLHKTHQKASFWGALQLFLTPAMLLKARLLEQQGLQQTSPRGPARAGPWARERSREAFWLLSWWFLLSFLVVFDGFGWLFTHQNPQNPEYLYTKPCLKKTKTRPLMTRSPRSPRGSTIVEVNRIHTQTCRH